MWIPPTGRCKTLFIYKVLCPSVKMRSEAEIAGEGRRRLTSVRKGSRELLSWLGAGACYRAVLLRWAAGMGGVVGKWWSLNGLKEVG